MRITNKVLVKDFINNLHNNLTSMQKYQQQLSTGLEVSNPSDNPYKFSRAMELNASLSANDRYKENIQEGIGWLDTTESALGQMGDVLQRVRELAVQAGAGSNSSDEQNSINSEMKQLKKQLMQIGNTAYDGRYVFGGDDTINPPFSQDTDGNIFYNGSSTGLLREFSQGVTMDVSSVINVFNSTSGSYGLFASNDSIIKSNTLGEDMTLEGSYKGVLTSKTGTDITGNFTAPGLTLSSTNVPPNNSLDLKLNGTSYTIDLSGTYTDINSLNTAINTKLQSITNNATNGMFSSSVVNDPSPATTAHIQLNAGISSNMPVQAEITNTSGNSTLQALGFAGTKISLNEPISENLKVKIDSVSNGVITGVSITTDSDTKIVTPMPLSSNPAKVTLSNGLTLVIPANVRTKAGDTYEVNLKPTMMDQLQTRLTANQSPSNMLDGLDTIINNVLKIRADCGAMSNRLDTMSTKNDDESYNMTKLLSSTEDIDLSSKYMEYNVLENVYNTSLAVGSKIMQKSLLDFLS